MKKYRFWSASNCNGSGNYGFGMDDYIYESGPVMPSDPVLVGNFADARIPALVYLPTSMKPHLDGFNQKYGEPKDYAKLSSVSEPCHVQISSMGQFGLSFSHSFVVLGEDLFGEKIIFEKKGFNDDFQVCKQSEASFAYAKYGYKYRYRTK